MKLGRTIALTGRNLARHRRRTVITSGAVAVGLMMFIVVDSILVGIEEESNRNIIRFETGVAQVVHNEYLAEREERPLKYAIENPEGIAADLTAAGLDVTRRTVFTGELVVFRDPFPEDGSVPVTAYGIDPAEDGAVYDLPRTVSQGEYVSAGTHTALVGSWLAEDIGAEVGFPITLVTRTRHGYYQTIDLEIAGIVTTPNPIINRNAVFVPLDIVGDYLQMEGAATEIAVGDTLGRDLGEITATMERHVAGHPELEVVSWRNLAADAVALAEAKESGTGVILFLVFVIAAVGVSNTMLMSVLERTRELGMMRAMGMRDRDIWGALLVEAGGIGLLGGVAGMVLGAGAVALLVEIGIDYGPLMRDTDVGYRITRVVHGAWNLPTFGRALGVGVVVCVLTAVVPVRRALRMSVVESLRAH